MNDIDLAFENYIDAERSLNSLPDNSDERASAVEKTNAAFDQYEALVLAAQN